MDSRDASCFQIGFYVCYFSSLTVSLSKKLKNCFRYLWGFRVVCGQPIASDFIIRDIAINCAFALDVFLI